MEFFDSHAHYNDEKFELDRDTIFNKLYNEEAITRITCVGYNVEQSKFAVKLANENSFLYSTVGISPNDIEDFADNKLEEINITSNDKSKRIKVKVPYHNYVIIQGLYFQPVTTLIGGLNSTFVSIKLEI